MRKTNSVRTTLKNVNKFPTQQVVTSLVFIFHLKSCCPNILFSVQVDYVKDARNVNNRERDTTKNTSCWLLDSPATHMKISQSWNCCCWERKLDSGKKERRFEEKRKESSQQSTIFYPFLNSFKLKFLSVNLLVPPLRFQEIDNKNNRKKVELKFILCYFSSSI